MVAWTLSWIFAGAKGFTIDEIDLSKLPGNFGGVKHDDNSDANARQEGFI